jgi:hypothetical protein
MLVICPSNNKSKLNLPSPIVRILKIQISVMQLVKKVEKPVLRNVKKTGQPKEQSFRADTVNTQELTVTNTNQEKVFVREHNYIPLSNHSVIESVGNSGWKVSDIWKDVRLDDF